MTSFTLLLTAFILLSAICYAMHLKLKTKSSVLNETFKFLEIVMKNIEKRDKEIVDLRNQVRYAQSKVDDLRRRLNDER